MTEVEKRRHRCCFTGHRPEKLNTEIETIQIILENEIRKAIIDGYTVFISGMSRGVDIWAAEIVLRLQNQGQPIRLICAVPYKNFEKNWEDSWRAKYAVIIETADLVYYLCSHYSPSCFQIRNKWMVDHSSRMIAVFNGTSGGTKNTIDYAKRKGIFLSIIKV